MKREDRQMKKLILGAIGLVVMVLITTMVLAQANPAEKPAKATPSKTFTGEFVSAGTDAAGTMLVVKSESETMTFSVCPMKCCSKRVMGTLQNLKKGQKIVVHYREEEGKFLAQDVTMPEP
jgi:hypothetical protein